MDTLRHDVFLFLLFSLLMRNSVIFRLLFPRVFTKKTQLVYCKQHFSLLDVLLQHK